MLDQILFFALPALLIIVILAILASGYVKAPPDVAYIISGYKREPRVLIGRAGIKIPYLERKDNLIVKQISIDIKTNGYIPTKDFIGVDIDAVAKVRVNTNAEGIQLAMKNFLNMREDQIAMALTDSLQGNMREIIGTVELKELCTDRKKFGDEVQNKAQQDMKALGIEIISCNIQKIDDEKGLIVALGQDNMSKIQKEASIAKAQADRDVAIAKAEADKASNDARVSAETEIAQKNNDLAIKKSELQKISDAKKAEADAAYEIQNQEQQKAIQTATVNAQIAKAEREAELRKQEVAIQQQALEAEINKRADADRYATEQKATAELAKRQREAEARKYEQEMEAEAKKAQAEAEKYQQEKVAEARKAQAEAEKFAMIQEAEGIRAKGEAEAAAIQAKGLAEAEAMEKKAEAYQKYNRVAMAEMMIKVLPDVAGKIAEPLSRIESIRIIGGGSGDGSDGIASVAGNVPVVMAKLFESMKETTGVDLAEIMRADTYDAKVTRNVNLSGLPEGNTPSEKPAAEPAE